MLSEVRGIVLRSTDIRETDRLITVYTEELGIITALARGARSLKSRKLASTQQFCYGSFVLYGREDKLWVKEASLIESFYSIRNSIEGLALAMYICEVVENVATSEPDRDILRLTLNSLFAISQGTYDLCKVKAGFEIRLASILGFMPDVVFCSRCGRGDGEFFFDVMAGAMECAECHKLSALGGERLAMEHESSILCILSEAAKTALCYCIYSPLEKLFSFCVAEDDMRLFARAAEEYLLNHLERGFKTLNFYNEVKR
jgi:DNA repair protein RecO (recombination protein O)